MSDDGQQAIEISLTDISLPIITMDAEARLGRATPAFCALLGLDPAAVAGTGFYDLLSPAYQPRCRDYLEAMARGRELPSPELELLAPAGESRLVEFSAICRREGERLIGFQCTLLDLRSQRLLGDRLLQQKHRLEVVNQTAADLHAESLIGDPVLESLKAMAALGAYQTGAVYRRLAGNRLVRLAAIDPAGLFPEDFVAEEGQTALLSPGFLKSPRLVEGSRYCGPILMQSLAAAGFERSLLQPLLARGRLNGLVVLGAKDRDADDEDVTAMQRLLGSCLGQHLERRSLLEEIGELRLRLKDLTDSSADHIWELDREGRYTYNSPSIKPLLGFEPEEMRGRSALEFIHPDDREDSAAFMLGMMRAGKPVHGIVFRLVAADGGTVYVESRSLPILEEGGEVRGYRGVDRNITDWFESKRTLEETLAGTCEALSRMVELRDPYTKGHSVRVSHLAVELGKAMHRSEYEVQGLRLMGLLHDIGKIGIPAEILSKPGRLTPEELELMRQHPTMGHEILEGISFPWPVAAVVHQHHERLDGSGYPLGLLGSEIIWQVRVLAVADLLEAMAIDRPYRPSPGLERAMQELVNNRGILYDDEVVGTVIALDERGQLAPILAGASLGEAAAAAPSAGKDEEGPDPLLMALGPKTQSSDWQ